MNKAEFQTLWASTVQGKPRSADSAQFVHRCMVKALLSKHPDKAMIARELLYQQFSPVSNYGKQVNGQKPFGALERAVASATHLQKSPLVAGLSNAQRAEYGDLMAAMCNTAWDDPFYILIFVLEYNLTPAKQAAMVAHASLLLGQTCQRENLYQARVRLYGVTSQRDLEDVPPHIAAGSAKSEKLYRDPVAWYEGKKPVLLALAFPPTRASVYRRAGAFLADNTLRIQWNIPKVVQLLGQAESADPPITNRQPEQ